MAPIHLSGTIATVVQLRKTRAILALQIAQSPKIVSSIAGECITAIDSSYIVVTKSHSRTDTCRTGVVGVVYQWPGDAGAGIAHWINFKKLTR